MQKRSNHDGVVVEGVIRKKMAMMMATMKVIAVVIDLEAVQNTDMNMTIQMITEEERNDVRRRVMISADDEAIVMTLHLLPRMRDATIAIVVGIRQSPVEGKLDSRSG